MHDHDHEHDHALSFDRRTFLAATSALSLFAMNDTAMAQQPAAGKGAPDKRLRQILAEFVVGFDLDNAPADVVARARVAFIDTIGVVDCRQSRGGFPYRRRDGEARRLGAAMHRHRAGVPRLAAAGGARQWRLNHAMDYDFTRS